MIATHYHRRHIVAAVALLLGSSVAAQTPPPALPPAAPVVVPPAAAAPAPLLPRVALATSAGTIVLEVDTVRAPVTAGNFLRYVAQKRFDGTSFYRALAFPSAPGFGLIQGGVRGDPKRVLKPIAHEPTSGTGILHTDGTISMARAAPGTANGDFFIVLGAIPSLDAQPGGDPAFAAFGHVVEGLDVARAIMGSPTSPTAGEGAMKGQILRAPVKITSARRQ